MRVERAVGMISQFCIHALPRGGKRPAIDSNSALASVTIQAKEIGPVVMAAGRNSASFGPIFLSTAYSAGSRLKYNCFGTCIRKTTTAVYRLSKKQRSYMAAQACCVANCSGISPDGLGRSSRIYGGDDCPASPARSGSTRHAMGGQIDY